MSGFLDIAGFSLLIGALIAAGLRKTRTPEEYLVAGRRVGLFALVATLVMTEFNTSTLLAFSGIGYSAGPMAVGLPLVFLVGLSWYSVAVARQWKRLNGLSVAELFARKYGRLLGRTASLFLITAMIGFSATYVKSLTLIFLPLLSTSEWVLSALLAALVLGITISGGLMSVVRSDVVSFLVTILLVPALLAAGWLRAGSFSALMQVYDKDQLVLSPVSQWNHPDLPFWFVTSLIVLTVFTYISSPWYGQKIFASRDERTAFIAVGISSVVVFLLYSGAILAASFYRLESRDLGDPQTVVVAMIESWMPPFFRGIGFALLFAVAMTTLTGVWSAMVAMCAADFDLPGLSTVRSERLLTFLFALLSWLGANLLVDNILNRLILANIPIAALSFALLAGFHWKRVSRAGAWASMVAGILWGAACFAYYGDAGGYTWYWAMYGIPVIFVTGAAASLAIPDAPREIV